MNQTRKPEGTLGKMMLAGMNSGHAKLADWGMTNLPDIAPKQIADLGCGGGRNAGELLKRYPQAVMTVLDYSVLSVQKSAEYNKPMIDTGRCTVVQGDVSKLPLKSDCFDLVTAFETIYFWNIEKGFAETARILKAGGFFMICNESDGTDKTSKKFESIIDGMHCYTPDEIGKSLKAAGFLEIYSYHHSSNPWITVIARKG